MREAAGAKERATPESVENSWIEFNRQCLNGALAEVRAALERYAQRESDGAPPGAAEIQPGAPPGADPPAIETLTGIGSSASKDDAGNAPSRSLRPGPS